MSSLRPVTLGPALRRAAKALQTGARRGHLYVPRRQRTEKPCLDMRCIGLAGRGVVGRRQAMASP